MCKYRSRENSIPLTALGKAAVSAQRQCWGRGGQAVGGTAGWGIWKCPIREFNSLTRARVLLFLRSPHTPHWASSHPSQSQLRPEQLPGSADKQMRLHLQDLRVTKHPLS